MTVENQFANEMPVFEKQCHLLKILIRMLSNKIADTPQRAQCVFRSRSGIILISRAMSDLSNLSHFPEDR